LLAAYGPAVQAYITRAGAKWHVDLKSLTRDTLIRCGLPPAQIDVSDACTCCGDAALFWSHRRHGEARGVHAGMIMLV
jgi:copper oxidase (laccase) domain-containing protein